MIRIQSGGEVFVAREGERLQPIGRVVSVEWNLNRPNVIDVEQTRPIIGYDPAAPEQPYMTAIVRGLAHGVARRRRRPGKLNETHEDFLTLQTHRRYPKRIDLARERHRLAELNRRDRRRRRTGRAAIGLQGPVEVRTRLPRVQIAPPEIDGHLRLIADQWATLQVRMNAAVRDIGRSFAAMSQAFANAFNRSTLEGMQRRINETVRAAAAGSIPHRFMAGTTPEWTVRDESAHWLQHACAELTESGRACRQQMLAGPYITTDELLRELEYAESRRADRERYYNERIRGGQIARQTRLATGGFVSPPCASDDDSIPAFLSPGEVYSSPEAIRRYGPLLQQINSRSARTEFDQIQDGLEELIGWRPAVAHVFALTPPDPEITHHDRYLGEGALERDETSSVHSTDSSGTGGSWADFLARLDDAIGEE